MNFCKTFLGGDQIILIYVEELLTSASERESTRECLMREHKTYCVVSLDIFLFL